MSKHSSSQPSTHESSSVTKNENDNSTSTRQSTTSSFNSELDGCSTTAIGPSSVKPSPDTSFATNPGQNELAHNHLAVSPRGNVFGEAENLHNHIGGWLSSDKETSASHLDSSIAFDLKVTANIPGPTSGNKDDTSNPNVHEGCRQGSANHADDEDRGTAQDGYVRRADINIVNPTETIKDKADTD